MNKLAESVIRMLEDGECTDVKGSFCTHSGLGCKHCPVNGSILDARKDLANLIKVISLVEE